jgi:hypothetical protein
MEIILLLCLRRCRVATISQVTHINSVTQTRSQSWFTTVGLAPFSSSWQQAPRDSRPEIFFATEPLLS